jgi:putative membrane protein
MSLRHLIAMAAGGLLVAASPPSPLHAQNKAVATPSDSVKADSRFIREVTAGNLLQVRLGEVAEQKATNSSVKQFAQGMVTDHQKLEDQWTDLASKHGMPFKPGLGRLHEEKLDRVQHADPKAFDRVYMTTVIQGHMDMANYFSNEGLHAHSAPVRKLVSYQLPQLKEDLRNAQQVGKRVGVDSATVARSQHVATRKK